jgi:hypothetical protein
MAKPPDQIHVLITCADGSVAVTTIVTAEYDSNDKVRFKRNPSIAYIEKEIARSTSVFEAHLLPIAGWRRLEDGDLPADRTFRLAWKDSSDGITVDMPKAREIHRQHLRVQRAPLLDALDVEYIRADEAGDTASKKRIAKRKQELRDVTDDPAIAKAKTPDELKAVMPPALGEK